MELAKRPAGEDGTKGQPDGHGSEPETKANRELKTQNWENGKCWSPSAFVFRTLDFSLATVNNESARKNYEINFQILIMQQCWGSGSCKQLPAPQNVNWPTTSTTPSHTHTPGSLNSGCWKFPLPLLALLWWHHPTTSHPHWISIDDAAAPRGPQHHRPTINSIGAGHTHPWDSGRVFGFD